MPWDHYLVLRFRAKSLGQHDLRITRFSRGGDGTRAESKEYFQGIVSSRDLGATAKECVVQWPLPMIFGEIFYFALLLATVSAYWLGPRRMRAGILATLGLFFYSYYAGAFVLLLAGLTLGSWLWLFVWGEKPGTVPPDAAPGHPDAGAHGVIAAEKVQKFNLSAAQIKRALWAIPFFVVVLAYYKYWGFFLGIFGDSSKAVIAPLAISFFTFEFIHVAAERAKGRLDHISLPDYFAFIFFFPTMIAGPIKRYEQFAEGFETPRLTARDALEGIVRIVLGLVKKMVIADNLNTLITEAGRPSQSHNLPMLTVAVILYGFRIYLDFSGYSDIAIGSARLLGFRVPENFLQPYRQSNISSFWRHWHVSLYSWLIDYVFIPLGGSRVSLGRGLVNIIIVMLVSGLWHGAAWNFVLWGLWHGCLLALHKAHTELILPKLNQKVMGSRPVQAVSYVATMSAVWFGWLLFMWPLHEVGQYLSLLGHKV